MEPHDDTRTLGRCITLFSGLAALGTVIVTGCLQINEKHCVAQGGDWECAGICTMSLGTKPEASTNGCMGGDGELVDFAHVKYGLPRSIGTSDDEGHETVRGLLALQCSFEQALPTAVTSAFNRLHDEVLDKLDGHSRVRVGSVELDGSVIDEFNKAIDDVCDLTPVDTDTDVDTSADTYGMNGTTSMSGTSEGGTVDSGCAESVDCIGTTGPFCDVEKGQCVSCGEMPEPDAACAEANPKMPLCSGDACVACTGAKPEACDQQLLACNPTTGTCVSCTEHAQCTSGACDVFEGTCFDPATVLEVGGGDGPPTIAGGLAALEALWPDTLGERRGVLVLHGGADFDEAAVIEEGSEVFTDAEAIAFVAAPGENPTWVYATVGEPFPTLTIGGMGTRVYLDGVTLRGNASIVFGWGLQCQDARIDIRRSRIVANMGGGIEARGSCELRVENSFVGVAEDDRDAISIVGNEAMATILYSTLGAGAASSSGAYPAALRCTTGMKVKVRNSLLVALTTNPAVVCPAIGLTNSAWEGRGLDGMNRNWFADYDAGDFHLTDMAPDDIQIADWQPGDPTIDIDGNPRITDEGEPDHAGADVP